MPTDWRQEPEDTERRRLPAMSQSDLRPPDPGPAARSSRYNHILHAGPALAGSPDDRNPVSATRGYVCVCVCVTCWG